MKTILTALLILVCCMVLRTSASAEDTADQMQTVVYPISFGEPGALQDISKSIVGDDGHVVLDKNRNRLIIVTTESKQAELKEILQPHESIPANIRIAVNMRGAKSTHNEKAAIHGSGSVIFQNGRKPAGHINLSPELENRRTAESTMVGQQLLIADGRSGSLRVGERVPYISWLMDYGWRYGMIEQHIEWQDVGSFLSVTPTILSDGKTIRITLTPQLRGLVDGNPYHTSFVDLSTEVIVQNGQTIQIGGADNHQDFYSRFLIGFNRQGGEETLNIELTPTITKPYAP